MSVPGEEHRDLDYESKVKEVGQKGNAKDNDKNRDSIRDKVARPPNGENREKGRGRKLQAVGYGCPLPCAPSSSP